MELREQLELVNVEYSNENKKVELTFLDKERKQIRMVNFNRQVYKDGDYVDSDEKAQKVDEWCDTYFGAAYSDLKSCIGVKKDIYCYERFNSLFEVNTVEKFTKAMCGQIYQTEIKEIVVDDYFIKIRYDIEGKTYESKQTFGKYFEDTKTWFQDPNKKEAEYKKFQDKYGVPVEQADSLIGHDLLVEVKVAFKTHYYGDIKAFPKGKK